jgi:uncharacterized protein (DUF58 family)
MHEDYGIVARVAELVARRGDATRLDATPRGRVRTLHAGAYASAHQGRGMEFDETRAYQAGDDVRAIDWRVTARTGRVHTKLFHEERERPVLLLVDQRTHMRFGTRDAFKSVVAARAAATVAWAARDRGDRVGGLILSDGPLRRGLHAPQRSRARLLHFLSALSDATAAGQRQAPERSHERAGTGSERAALARRAGDLPPHPLADALALLARTSRPGTLLWIISDFVDLDDEATRQLTRLSRRNQVACVLVHDALESALPSSDAFRVSDGTRVLELPTGSRRWRDEYAARFAARRERLETLCRERDMGFVAIRTGDDVTPLLRGGVQRTTSRTTHAPRSAAGGAR